MGSVGSRGVAVRAGAPSAERIWPSACGSTSAMRRSGCVATSSSSGWWCATTCLGNGAQPGTAPVACRTCGGVGEVQSARRSVFGTLMTSAPCPTCEGTGQEIPDKCVTCGGAGRVRETATVTLEIPAGVSDGMELRVGGSGHAGIAGAPAGDLYVRLDVEPPIEFERRNQDLYAVLDISITQATLGAEIVVARSGRARDDPDRARHALGRGRAAQGPRRPEPAASRARRPLCHAARRGADRPVSRGAETPRAACRAPRRAAQGCGRAPGSPPGALGSRHVRQQLRLLQDRRP